MACQKISSKNSPSGLRWAYEENCAIERVRREKNLCARRRVGDVCTRRRTAGDVYDRRGMYAFREGRVHSEGDG